MVQLQAQLHPALAAAFDALHGSRVRWALLRGPASLESPAGDVDLLVHPADLDLAEGAVRRVGFVRIARRPPGRSMLQYHAATHCWITLDLAPEVLAPEWRATWDLAAQCLARAAGQQPPRLAEGDAFWALLLHLSDEGRDPAARHRAQLSGSALQAGTGSPIARSVLHRAPEAEPVLEELVAAVCADDWPEVVTLLQRLRVIRDRRGRTMGRLRRGVGRAAGLLGAWRHRGLSVALLGPDGAGKSTLAACLAARSIFPVRILYMGTGSGGATDVRPAVVRWLRGPVLYALGGVAAQWLAYLSALGARVGGSMVVFDRYSEEALMPPRRSDPRWRQVTRRIRRLLVCPAPELAVILDAPAATMFARKGEHSEAILEEERRRYLALSDRLADATVLDAACSAEELCENALRQVWEAYARRHNGGAREARR